MSDSPEGPGWWQASDGKWYPPEQAPGGTPAPTGGGAAPSGGEPTVGEAISYGWAKFQANVGGLIVAALIGFGIMLVLTLIGWIAILGTFIGSSGGCDVNETTGRVTCDGGPGIFVTLIAYALFLGLVYFGQFLFDMLMIRAGLLTTSGEALEPSKLLNTAGMGPYLIGAILMTILAVIGFVFCIIPGILVLIFGRFFGYYILDKNMAPVDAIKASFNFVKDNFGKVFLFLLAVMAINWVGAILCYIGLLVTMPLTAIATAYFYKRYDGQPVAA